MLRRLSLDRMRPSPLALGAGFEDYWTKPIDFGKFLAGIDAIVASR